MWNLLKSELLKLRRCQILWVGLVALALCLGQYADVFSDFTGDDWQLAD